MTIEELKHLRDIVGCKLPIINDENRNKLNLLIDTEIARQSVKSEEVAEDYVEGVFRNREKQVECEGYSFEVGV